MSENTAETTDGQDGTIPEDGPAVPEELVTAIEENPEEVARLVQNLGQVNDLLDVSALATSAMDDEMVMTLAGKGTRLGEVVDTAGDEEVAAGLESVLQAVGDATEEEPEPVGLIGLMGALRDPEVKQGMGVAVNLLRALGETTSDPQK